MPVTAMEDVLSEYGNYCGEVEKTHLGLTKLEHFAGLAMQGIISGALAAEKRMEYEDVASAAIYQAKALLAQLEKGDE